MSNNYTKIPFPSEILKGEWSGTVYAVYSSEGTLEEHNEYVEETVKEIKWDFNQHNHYTVSLREVKRKLVYSDARTETHCTLIEFRVRDSF